MKQHYPKVPFFLIFFALLLYDLPSAFSQCTCSMGAAPNEIKHTVVLNPVISSNLTITFPKFDPSVGTLSCIRFEDSVSIQSSLGVRNLDTVDKSYRFRLSVTTDITGPSFTVNDFRDVIYGPDPLGAFGTATDSINYGPDTVYNNVGHQTYTSNVIPFFGAGETVDFAYSIGGGAVSLAGGLNFSQAIKTTTWGVFTLTYYWCEGAPLASGIKNFTATKNDDVVNLQWQGNDDDAANNLYEIQLSYDGKTFTTIQQTRGGTDAAKTPSAKYQYQYFPDQPADRKLYFRIKQSNGNTVKYSTIKIVDPASGFAGAKLKIYPNPVANKINMNFREPVTGNLQVEVANQVGQVVYSGNLRLNNANNAQVTLRDATPAGIYFLRAYRPDATDEVYSAKLIVSK